MYRHKTLAAAGGTPLPLREGLGEGRNNREHGPHPALPLEGGGVALGPLFRLVLILALAMVGATAGAAADDWTIAWWTIDGGGAMSCVGVDFELSGSIGQPDAGAMTGGDYTLVGGFWPAPSAHQLGDLNCDGEVNLFDIDPFVLALTSASNPDPFDDYYAVHPDCDPLLADIDGDGSVKLFDIDPFVELLTAK